MSDRWKMQTYPSSSPRKRGTPRNRTYPNIKRGSSPICRGITPETLVLPIGPLMIASEPYVPIVLDNRDWDITLPSWPVFLDLIDQTVISPIWSVHPPESSCVL